MLNYQTYVAPQYEVDMKKAKIKKPVKKAAVKKPVKKAVAKKAAPKKIVKKAVKKAVKKIVKKPAPKKISKPVKKAAAKKPVKKVAPKKAAAKKVVVKKAAPKAAPKASPKKVIAAPVRPVVKKFVAPAKPAFVVMKGEPLTAQELKEVKQHLIEMRDDAVARLKEQKEDMPEAEVGDPIDTASQSLDKEILFELSDNAQVLIDQIEAALRKIDKGIYGSCESCRILLPKKRIKALPFARYCVNCQSSNESRR